MVVHAPLALQGITGKSLLPRFYEGIYPYFTQSLGRHVAKSIRGQHIDNIYPFFGHGSVNSVAFPPSSGLTAQFKYASHQSQTQRMHHSKCLISSKLSRFTVWSVVSQREARVCNKSVFPYDQPFDNLLTFRYIKDILSLSLLIFRKFSSCSSQGASPIFRLRPPRATQRSITTRLPQLTTKPTLKSAH